MVYSNEALSYAIYMANKWSDEEASIVFNDTSKNELDNDSWLYSLGHHIWKKYEVYCKDYGIYGASMKLLYELDSENLKKILTRACELYDGRRNRK